MTAVIAFADLENGPASLSRRLQPRRCRSEGIRVGRRFRRADTAAQFASIGTLAGGSDGVRLGIAKAVHETLEALRDHLVHH